MWAHIDDDLRLGRVVATEADDTVLHIDLGEGDYATATRTGQPFPHGPGDWIYVRVADGHIGPAPEEVGGASERFASTDHSERLGVVVHVGEDELIVSGRIGLESISANGQVPCAEGYTVAYANGVGVVRVIAEEPLSGEKVRVGSVKPRYLRERRGDDPTYDDYAGNDATLRRARELLETPLREHDRLRRIGTSSVRGVLFTGSPGTGKTMLARVIAHESDAAFFEVSGPEIVSKWVGESERDLRDLFRTAENEERAIIFFDEIDSIAGRRNAAGQDHDQRLVAQFLTVLDGMSRRGNVIVIGATNRPKALDPALRRPGRFDWEIEFGLPNRDERAEILRVTSRGLSVDPTVDLAALAANTDSWTPADLASLWTEAGLWAARDRRDAIAEEDVLAAHHRRNMHRLNVQRADEATS